MQIWVYASILRLTIKFKASLLAIFLLLNTDAIASIDLDAF